MTDAESRSSRPVLAVLARIPVTLSLIAIVLLVGIVWGGLWRPFADDPLFDTVAYGLPALLEGRWWTPVTGTFFVNHPIVYAFVIPSFAGLAYLEHRRGSLAAFGYFGIGQLFAIFASALFLWLASALPWPWAQMEATVLDVGPSGGTLAGIAAAAGLLVSPWRVRAWLVVLGFSFVTLFFWGSLADLEHAFAVLLVLFVDRSLRIQRTTVREQRLIAFVAVLVILAVEVLTLLVPTDGPFGHTQAAGGSFLDIALDVVVIAILANGLRRGRRWAWIWTIVLAVVNVLTGALIIVLAAVLGPERLDDQIGDFNVALAQSAMWLLLLVYLAWVRRAFRARRKSTLGVQPGPTIDEVKDALRAHGGGTLSWMTTWDGNSYARTESGGIIAYQRRAGVAIVLADPLGAEASRNASVAEFIRAAEHAGLVPCFFSAGEATRAAVPAGWRGIVVADDTIVDLPGLEFTGKQWSAVRTSLNRAGREGMTFRLTRLADEPWGIRQQLRAISEMWVGDKGLPEMGFTLGTLDQAEDPEVRLALAISPQGDVDGFLSWLPVYGGDGTVRGWTLDLMRRRDGGFGPVMEFLIGSSARQFSEEGAEIMSLSGAPLAHDYPPDAGAIASLSDWLADSLEPVYGFQSLHRFKSKFHPRYETMYLLFRDEADLTRIGAGLTRAFLPDATLRQFAGAGMELVRGDRE
ncbi:bifunctional lysylphosphatidylglycerol flippase/synthetase MprF [Microbacterium sp. NPDC056003]|uniref:bifunctional lysylphosphatidylglycerol flippase/synthetase MprF n=1 Tax=Microbacterium sp. NPDC056003 TaxID=3345676 RepID=UPI0035E367E8